MPVKAPMYLKAPPNKKGKKPRLRDILSPDMISPPLGDFRHLMHIGGAAMDNYNDGGDVPDHRVNHQGTHVHRDLRNHKDQQQQINHLLQQQQPVLRPGRSAVHNASCLDAMRSPVLKNALTLPFTGLPRALDLPYLSAHYAPPGASPAWTPGARHSIAVTPAQGDPTSRGAAAAPPLEGHLRKPQSSGSVGCGGGGGRWPEDGAPCDRWADAEEEDEDMDVFAEDGAELAAKPWLRPHAAISRSLSVPVHGGHSVSLSAAGDAAAAASTGRVLSVPSLANSKAPGHRPAATLSRDGNAGDGVGKTRAGQRSSRFLQTMLVNAKLSKLFHHSSKNNVGDGALGGRGGGGGDSGAGGGFDDGTGGAAVSGQKTNSATRLWNRFSFSRGRDGSSSGTGGGGGDDGGGSKSNSAVKLRNSPVKATHQYPEASTLGRERDHQPGRSTFAGGLNPRGRLAEPSSRYSWSGSPQRDFVLGFNKAPFAAGRTSPGGDGIANAWVDGAAAAAALSTSQPLLLASPSPPSTSPSVSPPPPSSATAISTSQLSLSGTPCAAPRSSPPWAAPPASYAAVPPSSEPPPAPQLSSSSSSSLSSIAARRPPARSLFQRSRSQISAAFRGGIFQGRRRRRGADADESDEAALQDGGSQTQDRFVAGPARDPPAEPRNGTARCVPVAPADCATDQAGVQRCLEGETLVEHRRRQEDDALDFNDFGEIAMRRPQHHLHENQKNLQQQQHQRHDHQQQYQPGAEPNAMRRCSSKDSLDPFHLSGSLLSLGLDLGPSLLVDVLGVMDKPRVPSVGDPVSREPNARGQSSPERDSGVGCSDGDLPHADTPLPSPRPQLK